MIASTCPLRISLVGGSTDHPAFLKKYGKGSVISFPSNLHVYTVLHRDVFGATTINNEYIINYSKRENTSKVSDIQNELIRECFEHLEVPPLNCFITSDVFSNGSGLAASSAYLISLIKAVNLMKGVYKSDFEVCKIANEIEKKFNPLVGQQDFYGSMSGFKRITFGYDSDPEFKYFDGGILNSLDMYIVYTGVSRSSTKILQTINTEACVPLLKDVEDLELAILNRDLDLFNSVIKRTWRNKKATSPSVCDTESLKKLDQDIENDPRVLSHKLLGAGGGGYFLLFTNKGVEIDYPLCKKIELSKDSISTINLYGS
jgi:D-glycero-alpha-D-manno-heptose-7-phosphate kinase